MSGFVKLTSKQIDKKIDFIKDYTHADNPASGSKLDANANVTMKNLTSMSCELNKDINIQINRQILYNKISKLFDDEIANEYIRQLEEHEIYTHDETSLMPYCVAISMYPFLTDGMKKLGGEALAPKHLHSFCGSFVNLIFSISCQFAGAVATVEFLTYFDYFARKDYGENYLETHKQDIIDCLQQVVYCLNQPAGSRNYQCVREDTTQLMTPTGFKWLEELHEGDECYVLKDGKIAVEKIKKLNVYDYNGELIQFKGRNYQQTVTPNHRVVYKIPNTSEYKIKEAKDLVGHSKMSCPIAAKFVEEKDYEISDELLQICVAILTDGTIFESKKNPGTHQIAIYSSENRWGSQNLPRLLDAEHIKYKITETHSNKFGKMNTFTIKDTTKISELLNGTKRKLPEWFRKLSSRQALLVIDTWTKFDGSEKNGNYSIQCDNEEIQEMMQEVAFKAGLGSEKTYAKFHHIDGTGEVLTPYVKTFKRDCKRVSEFNEVEYHGRVWCPTTDAGIVVMREENGVPYITGNSTFWNISLFDENYFNSLFGNFYFPDFTQPSYDSVKKLQNFFMKWFNDERTRAILTFPVVTAAMLVDEKGPKDKRFAKDCAKHLSEGNSFFIYESDSVDSLSSCCRLRNELADNEFSYSLGAGGVKSGSINVITMNVNKLIQETTNKICNEKEVSKQVLLETNRKYVYDKIYDAIREMVEKIQKYQVAYRSVMESYKAHGMLPVYDAGFIELDKQFLTTGINGLVEGCEFLGLKISDNEEYKDFVSGLLKVIYDTDKAGKNRFGYKFNLEFVPAENLGVKNAKWDREAGLEVNRDCYNSYFYAVEDDSINVIDKFRMHGKQFTQFLDGGSALHFALEEHPDAEQYYKMMCIAAKEGCNYWTTNIRGTYCESCGHIDKHTLDKCPACGSTSISYLTRVIGYLKKISNFSKERQKEALRRYYHKSSGLGL